MRDIPAPLIDGKPEGFAGDVAGKVRGLARLAGILTSGRGYRIDAVDVARYQGAVDWPLVREHTAGHLVAWKATQGRSWVDPYHARNRTGTAAAGFTHRLMYHWLDHDVPIDTQMAHLLRTVMPLARGEGIMLDVEEGGITLEHALEAAARVEAVTGRPVAVYTGRYVDGGRVWRSTALFDGRRPRIFAAYTTRARAESLAAPFGWDMWQHGSTYSVPGIPARVDGNEVADLAAFDACCGIDDTPEPPTEDDEMGKLYRPDDGDVAIFAAAAGVARWVRTHDELDRLRFAGQVTGEVIACPRDLLRDMVLAGPAPKYPAGYDGPRTTGLDFGALA